MIRSALKLLGFRDAWDLLGCLRLQTLMVAFVVFFVGFSAVSEKVPWISWIAVLLVVAVRNSRRWRGSTSRHRQAGHIRGEPRRGRVRHAGLAG